MQNGVLVQNNTTLWGNTVYIGSPTYEKHAAKESLMLQDHSHLTSFRNIWIRRVVISKIAFMKSFFICRFCLHYFPVLHNPSNQETVFHESECDPDE
jgi:hypothetical protein